MSGGRLEEPEGDHPVETLRHVVSGGCSERMRALYDRNARALDTAVAVAAPAYMIDQLEWTQGVDPRTVTRAGLEELLLPAG